MATERTISLPFTVDPYGAVGSTTSQTKIWADRVRSVIGTSLRERVMRPDFGTVIPFAMFETMDDAGTEIRAEIDKAFNEQLPLLSLEKVELSIDESSSTISATITYDLPNNETVSTTIGLIGLKGNNPALEELL